MSVVADRKQIALNTSLGSQVVSLDLGGADPKALVFSCVSVTTEGARNSQNTGELTSYCRGYSDGTTQGCLSEAIEEGLAPDGALWNNAVVVIHDATGTVEAQVSVASVSADQVTLSIDTAPSSAYLVEVLALSGSSLTDAAVTTGTLPTGGSPSTVNDEDVGFEPDGMLMAGLIRNASFNTIGDGGAAENGPGHGVALGPTDRHGYASGPAGWRGGGGGSTTAYSEAALLPYDNDETWDTDDPLFDASGFNLTLDFDEGHDGIYVALSLAGVSLHRETLTQPISSEETAPVTQSITGLAFEPAAALVGSANQPSGTVSGAFFVEGFASAPGDQAAVFFHVEDGTSQGDVAYATDRILTSRDPTAPSESTVELAGMQLSSFDADGATFNWPAIDDVARQHGVLLIGPADSGGDTTPPSLSNPSISADGSDGYSGSFDTDEGDGTRYTVITTSATVPSEQQVVDGQDHTGSAAAASESAAVSATGTQNIGQTGVLSASTQYHAYTVHEDAAGNRSAVLDHGTFTTASSAANPPDQPTADGPDWISGTAARLTSSAYSEPDGDPHASSDWQVDVAGGDFSSPVYEALDSADLEAHNVPTGTLSLDTDYIYRVRHTDADGDSLYSTTQTFTTTKLFVLMGRRQG